MSDMSSDMLDKIREAVWRKCCEDGDFYPIDPVGFDVDPAKLLIAARGRIKELEAGIEEANQECDKALAKVKKLRAALQQLACLGNGDRPGNSEGNMIARRALKATNDE